MTAQLTSKKSLGAGSIGGRGWWIVRDTDFNPDNTDLLWMSAYNNSYNTNLITERTVDEACTFNEKLPHIGMTIGHPECYTTAQDRPAITVASDSWNGFLPHLAENLAGGVDLYLRFCPVGVTPMQRHVHRVLVNNRAGTPLLDDAVRIQVGNSGYTDTLPGLFLVQPVPGSLVEGVSCQVTVTQANNNYDYWAISSTTINTNNFYNYGSTLHPYLRYADAPITVSVATGNHNRHVLPGVDLQFNPDMVENGQAIVSVGYEYVNAATDAGDIGEIGGRTDYYQPMAAYGLVQLGKAVSNSGAKGGVYKWRIYNVSGALQEGCQFHVRPLVRLDQGNAITPFDQWFMGNVNTCSLPKSETPYQVTFSGFVAGTPNTITLHCSQAVSMVIHEVDSTSYVVGAEHADASGLKCDGSTLYLWDALGIYFVLSTATTNSSTAQIWVKHGDDLEKRLDLTNAQTGTNYTLISAPFAMTIGGWAAITGNDSVLFPVSPFVEETYFSGKIQTQGYDFDFAIPNSGLEAYWFQNGLLYHNWVNHDFEVAMYPTLASNYAYVGLQEYCVMVTCDDPRYFQVVPMTFIPTGNRVAAYGTAQTLSGSALIAVPNDPVSLTGMANILQTERDLVVRVNQIPADLVDLMADHGVFIE